MGKAVAILGSTIQGTTTGEHAGHYINGAPVHGASTITGTITNKCSSFFNVDGKAVAVVGSTTSESDDCDSGQGTVSSGSDLLKVDGVAVARVDDTVTPHNGTAKITSGSNFFITE